MGHEEAHKMSLTEPNTSPIHDPLILAQWYLEYYNRGCKPGSSSINQSCQDAFRIVDEELEKRIADLAGIVEALQAQLDEASASLREIKKGVEQKQREHDAQESELKEHKENLQHIKARHSKRVAEFHQKNAELQLEAAKLISDLRNWCSL